MKNPVRAYRQWNERKLLEHKARGHASLLRYCLLSGAAFGVLLFVLHLPIDYYFEGAFDLSLGAVYTRVLSSVAVWFFIWVYVASYAREGLPWDNK